ncbi:MAG: hypothetical protein A2V67_05320 [Deltaproteobacteria bacterium RBG_13_61_14]|nr:MAG: hypothetical protein A2V67_05320 [Deltaproteobacteria bacterium RBG_13_61_14]
MAQPSRIKLPPGYTKLLEDLKDRIRQAQVRAAWAVNQELLLLYYGIGLELHRRFEEEAWGTGIINRLSRDLLQAFPDLEGFSPRNLRRMRAFYRAYPLDAKALKIWPRAVAKMELIKWPPAVAKLPWAHNVILLEKCKDPKERQWYAQAALEYGWSRDILALQIESGLFRRKGKAITNFRQTLPATQSDLAQQITKDPYHFDFLTLSSRVKERDLQTALIHHLKEFLVELGVGFAYLGSQVRLPVEDEDYYLDLLFYHVRLRCYVVIELKEGDFKPEYAGKMNFYLSAVDDRMRLPDDKPSIGLILCRGKNRITAEYALRDIQKPIGVADWKIKLVETLPENLKGSLPTIEELEAELGKATGAGRQALTRTVSNSSRRK